MNVVPMVSSFVPLSLKEGWEERDIIEIQREREREEGEGGREEGRDGGRVSKRECVYVCKKEKSERLVLCIAY